MGCQGPGSDIHQWKRAITSCGKNKSPFIIRLYSRKKTIQKSLLIRVTSKDHDVLCLSKYSKFPPMPLLNGRNTQCLSSKWYFVWGHSGPSLHQWSIPSSPNLKPSYCYFRRQIAFFTGLVIFTHIRETLFQLMHDCTIAYWSFWPYPFPLRGDIHRFRGPLTNQFNQ